MSPSPELIKFLVFRGQYIPREGEEEGEGEGGGEGGEGGVHSVI